MTQITDGEKIMTNENEEKLTENVNEKNEKGSAKAQIRKTVKNYVPRINTKVLVLMGLLVAVQFILERVVVAIETPIARVSFTFVGRAVTGACLGPAYSALVGVAADLLGCFYKAYTPNPGITFAALFRGVAFGVFLFRKQTVPKIIAAAVCDQFIAGLVITTLALFWFGGIPFTKETILTRLVQCAVLFVIELIFLLSTRNNLFVQIKKYLSVMNRYDRI